jgi:hypothetical protein
VTEDRKRNNERMNALLRGRGAPTLTLEGEISQSLEARRLNAFLRRGRPPTSRPANER